MQQVLQIFEYESSNRIRTVNIGGDVWFVAKDVCDALGIGNHRDAISRLDDDEKDDVGITDAISRRQRTSVVSESGLYNLIFQSRKPEAKKFRKWVTQEVLPSIRKGGFYGLQTGGHNFVRRYNDNWDRVSPGYFSVISELYIRLYGRFEQVGHLLADRAKDGKEVRPDVSVGMHFSKWLKQNHPEKSSLRKKYNHLTPEGMTVEAFQYPLEMLPIYIEFVDQVWLRQHATEYLKTRDSIALEFLPKLLPPSTN